MQPNQHSFNIFVVSYPVAHCTPILGHNGLFFVVKIS